MGSAAVNATRLPLLNGEAVDALLSRHGRDPHALVQILREAQELQGWLPRHMLGRVARELGLTLAHVEGVAGLSASTGCCSATTSPIACWAARR